MASQEALRFVSHIIAAHGCGAPCAAALACAESGMCLHAPQSVFASPPASTPPHPRAQGTKQTARLIWKADGVRGFYRGFTTIMFGAIPARVVYLGSLEVAKDAVLKACRHTDVSDTVAAGLANSAGGAAASLSTQLVTVPIDVVSQRQMVHGADTHSKPPTHTPSSVPPNQPAQPASASHTRQFHTSATQAGRALPSTPSLTITHRQLGRGQPASSAAHTLFRRLASGPGGSAAAGAGAAGAGAGAAEAGAVLGAPPQRVSALTVVRGILREEGVVGMYRGLGVSVATFVPSGAVW